MIDLVSIQKPLNESYKMDFKEFDFFRIFISFIKKGSFIDGSLWWGSGFCDNSTKALEIKSMTIERGGVKNCP
jgi:hypothetical protein